MSEIKYKIFEVNENTNIDDQKKFAKEIGELEDYISGKLHEEGNGEYSSICSKIWDACSQMEMRLQTSFPPDFRRILFGNNYDSLETIGSSDDIDFGEKNKSLLNSLKFRSKNEDALSLDYIIDKVF